VPGSLVPGLSSAPVKIIRFSWKLPAMHVDFMCCEKKSQVKNVNKKGPNLTFLHVVKEKETRS